VEGDRQSWLFELMQAIARPEVPSIQDVRIMSLHKSKGLSAPVTIVAGCVEGLLPQQPEPGTPHAQATALIEEQRRLFFVAISRVKAVSEANKPGTLILTYSRRMPVADAMQANIRFASRVGNFARLNASRFINELGPRAPQPIPG
jgi:superfamily I DNA/RNA helicase